MKKFLLSLLMMVGALAMSAATFSGSDFEAGIATGKVELQGYTFTFDANGNQNAPQVNGSAKDVRMYANSKMTIVATAPMTKITFNLSSKGKQRLAAISASAGAIATQAAGDATVVWTGNATEVTFTVGEKAIYGSDGEKAAGQFDWDKIYINEDPVVTPPVDPTDLETVADIAAYIAKADATKDVKISGTATVVYQNGVNLFLKDNSGWLLAYGDTKQTYKNGDQISGFAGKYSFYQDLIPEMNVLASSFGAATAGTAVNPSVITIPGFATAPVSSYVEIQGVTVAKDPASYNGRGFIITDASGNSIPMYQSFTDVTVSEGTGVTVRGFVSGYAGVRQLAVNYLSNGGDTPVTPGTEVANIAEWLKKADTDNNVAIKNPVTAVFQNGSNLFVQDESGSLLIYGSLGKTYKNGDIIPGGIAGKYKDYFGVPEFMSDKSTFGNPTAGAPVEPNDILAEDLENEPISSYVQISDVTIALDEADAKGKTYKATDIDGGVVTIYNSFGVEIPTGAGYVVRGFVGYHNGYQITVSEVVKLSDINKVVAPVFSCEGEVEAGTKVTISTTTPGAEIYYTTDGTAPSASSTKYTEPIVINGACTIAAIAIKAGMDNSDVTTATYTIAAPIQDAIVTILMAPDYTNEDMDLTGAIKLTNKSEVAEGGDAGADDATSLNNKNFSASTFDFVLTKGSATKFPAAYGSMVRWFQNAQMTITPKAGYQVRKVELVTNSQYADKAEPTATTGEVTKDVENMTYTWKGVASSALTLTANAQIRFYYVAVTTAPDSGIENISAADGNAPVEYYNLQGVRVENPANGLYIRRQGNTATKVLVK